jgi:hypothetical protein
MSRNPVEAAREVPSGARADHIYEERRPPKLFAFFIILSLLLSPTLSEILAPRSALAARSAKKAKPAPAATTAARWPFPPAGIEAKALAAARQRQAVRWLNSRPLFAVATDPQGNAGLVSIDSSLEGKLVLLCFWDYTNAHALRLWPWLSGWNDRYAKDGLVIAAVHAPGFAFAADPANVAAAVKRLGIRTPVIIDSDFLVWRAFANRFWPRTILILPGGRVGFDHVGERGTAAMEVGIRTALGEMKGKRYDLSLLPPPPPDRADTVCRKATPDTFCGSRRGRLGSPGYPKGGGAGDFRIPAQAEVMREGTIYLAGRWRASDQALFPDGSGPAELRLRWSGVDGSVVLTPPPAPANARVIVTLDGKPVPAATRGSDVRADASGATGVTLDGPRLYDLVAGAPFGSHEIGLAPEAAGTGVYAFFFGGCEKRAEP